MQKSLYLVLWAGLLLLPGPGCQPPVDEPPTRTLASSLSLELRAPPPAEPARHPRLSPRLLRLEQLERRAGLEAALSLARQTGVERTAAGEALVTIVMQRGHSPALVRDEHLAAAGARAVTRGLSRLDAAVPIPNLSRLADRLPAAVATVEALERDEPDVGGSVSQGLDLIAGPKLHCTGSTGAGVHVAVVDVGFQKWSDAISAGDLPKVTTTTPSSGSTTHGTSCSEVVADVAPGATIEPILLSNLTSTESWIKNKLPTTKAQILTRSLSSIGGGFDDGKGTWCDMTKKVADKGVLWINSAGNNADGKVYRATFSDSDSDGWHQYSGSSERNEFTISSSSQIRFQLDWNDYPASAEDYNLYAYWWDGSTWVKKASSTKTQSGTQEPREFLTINNPDTGKWSLSIYRKSGTKSGMALRLMVISGSLKLKYNQAASSLNTVSACADVMAVGAIRHKDYTTGPQALYSSQGPTFDNRVKPELSAPTDVATEAKSSFGGTSAATPHVAGAAALYLEAGLGKSPIAAGQEVVKDTTAMGTVPNNIYGAGRLALAAARTGWECEAKLITSCTTSCATTGDRTCGSTCAWGPCVPPIEICNGKDDDCDTVKDNGFACAVGAEQQCTTSCATKGKQTCASDCSWGACESTEVEICNGKDDDCDGETDEDGVCPPDLGITADAGVDSGGADAAGDQGGDDGGCSCAVARPNPERPGALLLGLLALACLCVRVGRR